MKTQNYVLYAILFLVALLAIFWVANNYGAQTTRTPHIMATDIPYAFDEYLANGINLTIANIQVGDYNTISLHNPRVCDFVTDLCWSLNSVVNEYGLSENSPNMGLSIIYALEDQDTLIVRVLYVLDMSQADNVVGQWTDQTFYIEAN